MSIQQAKSATLAEKLTNRTLLLKNISLNFIIQGVTFLIGIITVPTILNGIGVDRFGILTIVWAIIGYSSLFDFGLGRALTQIVSSKLGAGKSDEVPSVIWTSLMLISGLGVLGAAILFSMSDLITHFMNVPPQYRLETLQSLQMLFLSLPFMIYIISLKGVLEAYQKFDYTNWLRIPILISNYIVPIILLQFSHSLTVLVIALIIGRLVTCAGHFWAVSKTVEYFWRGAQFSKAHFMSLFRFGGWLTISGIINPFMSYLDRFIISGLLTSSVIAYYATPYDVIAKMTIVSAAVMSVIFPAITTEFINNPARARTLYRKSLLSLSLILLVPVMIILLFAKPLLSVWINPQFAEHSYQLAQILSICFFLTCLNTVPYSVIQAIGRSDVTAKIYLLEFPIYMTALFFTVKQFGIMGAPLAALIRLVVDSLLMHKFALSYLHAGEAEHNSSSPPPNRRPEPRLQKELEGT